MKRTEEQRAARLAIEVDLWKAIDRYAVSVGGDPTKRVYGNVERQEAVATIGGLVRRFEEEALTAAQARIAELEAKVEAAVCRCLDEENSGGAVRTVTRDCPLHASCPDAEADFVESYGELLRCKCGLTMLDALNDFRSRLAAAERDRDEAREQKRLWVEQAGRELDAQRREIESLLTERDEAQRKLAGGRLDDDGSVSVPVRELRKCAAELRSLREAEAKLAEAERERVESLAALGGLPEFSLLEQCQKRQAQLNDIRSHVNALEDGAMGTTVYIGQIEKRLADAEAKLAVVVDGLARAELHARSALKSWEDGNEHTVTHVRDVENAANVCAGVLTRIRSM